jgi:hypothetical protein
MPTIHERPLLVGARDVPKLVFSTKKDSLEHSGISETINMNKYHLLLVMERLKKGSKVPGPVDVWPWVGTFVAFLLSAITAEPRDLWGLKAAVWESIFVIAAILSLVMCFCRGIQAYTHRKERAKTPENEVDDIIKQMASDREKISG